MIRTQEATGKTVDEARANACAKLGVQADDINVSYEVLEMPQKTGFLGLKLTPAKVRVTVEEADPVPAAPVVEEKAAPAPVAEEPKAEEKTPVEEAPAALAADKLPPHSPWKRRRQRLPLLRTKRWKCPSISKRTTRSRPLWTICVRSSRGWAWRT